MNITDFAYIAIRFDKEIAGQAHANPFQITASFIVIDRPKNLFHTTLIASSLWEKF